MAGTPQQLRQQITNLIRRFWRWYGANRNVIRNPDQFPQRQVIDVQGDLEDFMGEIAALRRELRNCAFADANMLCRLLQKNNPNIDRVIARHLTPFVASTINPWTTMLEDLHESMATMWDALNGL